MESPNHAGIPLGKCAWDNRKPRVFLLFLALTKKKKPQRTSCRDNTPLLRRKRTSCGGIARPTLGLLNQVQSKKIITLRSISFLPVNSEQRHLQYWRPHTTYTSFTDFSVLITLRLLCYRMFNITRFWDYNIHSNFTNTFLYNT